MGHYDVSVVGVRSRGHGVFERAAGWGAALGALLVLLLGVPAQATSYYTYDILGRITQVVESDGTTTQYTYDANGNITSINRIAGTTALSIGSISTSSGAVGSSITINGSGFSSIASQDTVTINGVAAQVTYASDNRLVVTVPTGATSGDIQITTTQNGSATSSSPFTVVPVSISSFSPASGVGGAVVTINGGGFDPTPANNTVLINGVAATVSSATTSQLQVTVPAGATPGHISVTAPLGSATSTGDFFVPAAGYTLSQVSQVAVLAPGGAGHVFPINGANQVGVALFDGVVGQRMSIAATNLTASMHYTVFAPDGSTLASDVINSSSEAGLPALPRAGTYAWYYTLSVIPGSATFNLLTDVVGGLPVDGTPTLTSLAPGQNATYTFTGTAGQSYNLTLAWLSGTGGEVNASLFNPDGSFLHDCGSFQAYYNGNQHCDFSLGANGTYFLRVTPSFGALFASSFNTYVIQDFSATLTAGTPGPGVAVTLVPNQHGLLDFTATTNQTLALYFGTASVSLNGDSVQFSVTGPVNPVPSNIVGPNSPTNGQTTTYNFNNLAAGTYQVLISPFNNGAAVSMPAVLANGATATLPVNGTTSTPIQTYVPGQAMYLTFAGTAGQNLGLALTQLALTPGTVGNVNLSFYKPDGSYYTSATCYSGTTPGCPMGLRSLPQTGNYQVVVNPGGPATMELAMTVSQDVSGALTLGTPANITLTSDGQNALYTFTANGSEPVVLTVGSISTSPANTPVTIYVYDSNNNNVVPSQSMTRSGLINLGILAAGTYSVLVVPNDAATGSLQMALQQGITGTLATDGTPSGTLTLPNGEEAYLTFSGTAGTTYNLALTNIVTAPSGGTINFNFTQPNGSSFSSSYYCGETYTANDGSCDISPLPTTGTYTVRFVPANSASASFNVVLAQSANVGSLTLNGPPLTYSTTIPGQNGELHFAGTAGQTTLTVTYSGNTIPAGTLSVWDPNGNHVAGMAYNGTSSGSLAVPALTSTGTYTVRVFADGNSTGQMTVGLVADVVGTVATDGTPQPIVLNSGQRADLTFSGTAGTTYNLALTNVSTVPSGGTINFSFTQPNGSSFSSSYYCGETYTANDGSCDISPLPTTGTYTVRFVPANSASASFNVVLAQSANVGTLIANGPPLTYSTTIPGQNGELHFSGTAGQTLSVSYSGNSIPAGTLSVWDPNGNHVAGMVYNGTSSGSLAVPALTSTGTYTVRVFADGNSTGQMTLQLVPR